MLEFNGSVPLKLIYWIQERKAILANRRAGLNKPWSDDPVFQRTYFCNVRRENDKVTQFIRRMYDYETKYGMFEYNIVLARMLNWPESLQALGYIFKHDGNYIKDTLNLQKRIGKVWGNAYVVTTHGIPMDKIEYLVDNVLYGIDVSRESIRNNCSFSLRQAWNYLQRFEGLGSFMAGQIIADLKNTAGHPLEKASDWWDFVAPGPGSRRGVNWFFRGAPEIYGGDFFDNFQTIREFVDKELPDLGICNQDLQNCLCEFDKYMRVSTGIGRSKRVYNGAL